MTSSQCPQRYLIWHRFTA